MADKALAVTVRGDLDALKESAYNDLVEADRHAALAVVYAARAGGRFLAMKEIVESTRGYGSWGTWVAANVQLSARSVQFYMQLARSLPALADPAADTLTVLESSPAARELAGLSLRQAMRKLGEPNARGPKAEAPEAAEDAAEAPPADPTPIVLEWARKQLPRVPEPAREALVTLWLAGRRSDPLDGELFELVCEAWALGNHAKAAGLGKPRPR
jgi:hypothetical protein